MAATHSRTKGPAGLAHSHPFGWCAKAFLSIALLTLLAQADDPQLAPAARQDSTVVVGEDLPQGEAAGAIRLVVTGNVEALLQWCACETGKGFLSAKRVHLIREASKGQRALLIDAGRAFSGVSDLDRKRGEAHLATMESLGYDTALLGPDAWALGDGFSVDRLSRSTIGWTCSNLTPPRPAALVEAQGRKIGLVGLISLDQVPQGGTKVSDPVPAWLSATSASEADLFIAFGQLNDADVERLAACDRPPAAILTSAKAPRERLGMMGRVYENPEKTAWSEWGCGRLVVGGVPVFYTEVLGPAGHMSIELPQPATGRQGYRHVLSAGTTPDDAEAKRLTDAFFAEVRGSAKEDSARYAKSSWDRELELGRGFVGAKECGRCHEPEAKQWASTRHEGAYISVASRDRWFYPLCVSCHVTGLGRPSGFAIGDDPLTLLSRYPGGPPPGADLTRPLGMEGVQCEACHGPGSAHAKAPSEPGLILKSPPTSLCVECHDPKNSPRFSEREYIEKVRH
ncbi:MAG: multiheme c-type cytochrome [Planctomycetota bacterium]